MATKSSSSKRKLAPTEPPLSWERIEELRAALVKQACDGQVLDSTVALEIESFLAWFCKHHYERPLLTRINASDDDLGRVALADALVRVYGVKTQEAVRFAFKTRAHDNVLSAVSKYNKLLRAHVRGTDRWLPPWPEIEAAATKLRAKKKPRTKKRK